MHGSVWAGAPKLAQGNAATYSVDSSGNLFVSGDDSEGQLGLGRVLSSYEPVRVPGLGRIKDIASGGDSVLALAEDGTVWGWGRNVNDVLLDGSGGVARPNPVRLAGLSQVSAVAVGFGNAMALTADGSVWTWGVDFYNPASARPQRVPGLSGVVAINLQASNMLALRADGTVWVWGFNAYGQFGDGSRCADCRSSVPRAVPGLSGVVRLDASWGRGTLFAVKSDGTLWAWGQNSFRFAEPPQVLPSPAAVPDTGNVHSISSSGSIALALRSDGSVLSWTSRTQTGTALLGDSERVAIPRAVSSVAAGYAHAAAVDTDGNVWTWGLFAKEALGRSTASPSVPGRIPGLSGVRTVRIDRDSVVALGADGSVWTWGLNESGQLGIGQLNRNVATRVPSLSGVVDVSAARGVLALTQDGTVWEWGGRFQGSSTGGERASVPTRVAGLPAAAQVAAGANVNLALARDGTVWGWGWPWSGALGKLAVPGGDSVAPTRLAGLSEVAAVAVGEYHALFLKRDGTVLAMGANEAGQLGATDDGSCTYSINPAQVYRCSRVPLAVPGLSGVAAVHAFGATSYAVLRDGSVWAWGANDYGQAGLPGGNCRFAWPGFGGSFPCWDRPQRVPIPLPVTALSRQLALTSDGALWRWGTWGFASAPVPAPAPLPGISGIAVIPSSHHDGFDATTSMMRVDGQLLALGRNVHGQLGDGTYAEAFAPVRVLNEDARNYLSLLGVGGGTAEDPLSVLQRIAAQPGQLSVTLTDPRLVGLQGEVYFAVLLPSGSPLLGGSPAAAAALRPGRPGRAASGRRVADAAATGMVSGVLTRGGFKQTGGTSYAAADSAYAGSLSQGTTLTVYEALADPLIGSNALVCVGLTIPELSAKGQVLMRPVANGSQTQGVVQCPPVQTAATVARFRVEASGPVQSRTVVATIEPLAEERGRQRQVFAWAVTPDGRQYMQTGPNQWAAMAEPMQAAGTVQMPAVGTLRWPVAEGLDLGTLVGTLVFVGIGESWESVRKLNQAGHVYTVQ